MSHPLKFLAACALCAVALISGSIQAMPDGSNKWRLEFSGAAESAGEIVLEIAAPNETPIEVKAVIDGNDGENRVARKVKRAIDRQAGRIVDAELDDGEDVLVKRHLFRQFSIRLVSNSVKGVRIRFDRE
jgi:hypothetical protein